MAEDYSKLSDKELIEKYHEAKTLSVVYDLSQLAKKILLNSCYGAIGNAYFLHNDVKIARAITLMGQVLINKSANETNRYMNKILHNKEDNDYRLYSDTDSLIGNTIIDINGSNISIEDFYNKSNGLETENNGKYIKKLDSEYKTKTINDELDGIVNTNVNYIMKHKTPKHLYKLTVNGKDVIVTEDHSIMILRNNKLIKGSVKDLQNGDEIIIDA